MRTENLDSHSRRTLRSLSTHALTRDYKTPVEGLKKFAISYKNSISRNKIETEKSYRSSAHKEKKNLTDPRFRRERTRSPKKSNFSQSQSQLFESRPESQVNSQSVPSCALNKHLNKLVSKQSPIDIVQNYNIEQEYRSLKHEYESDNMLPPRTSDAGEMEHYIAQNLASSSLANQAETVIKSIQSEETKPDYPSEVEKEFGGATDNFNKSMTMSSTSGSLTKRNAWGIKNMINYSKVDGSPFWDDPRLLKKYINLVSLKKTKSSMTLPFILPKTMDGICMCMKCSCMKNPPDEYTFDNTTLDGSNSVTLDRDIFFKENLNGSYYMVISYLIGCICGLTLVALIAWILSNDLIWTWVNHPNESSKTSFINKFFSYIGGALFFTLNFIFGGIYNIFILPRSAVFKSEDKWSIWKYFN